MKIELKTSEETLYEVTNGSCNRAGEGAFIMAAPLSFIAKAFDLFPEAVTRVDKEIATVGYCELFFNARSRSPFGFHSIIVALATEVK